MPADPLKPMTCSKCGAPLEAEEHRQVVTCPYCGLSHRWAAPRDHAAGPRRDRARPAELGPAPRALLGGGASWITLVIVVAVLVAGGAFALVAWLTAGGPDPSRAGRSAAAAPRQRAGASRSTGNPNASYEQGDLVQIHWGSTWYDGRIVEVRGEDRYLIHYDGWSASWDEEVGPRRLRPRTP